MSETIGFAKALLLWYRQSARELPWRSVPTPYRVWISEIMLQQTRVEAGKGYFLRFVAELPDVFALAAVSDQHLMKLWEGLGYYNRARNLKKAAQLVVDQYGGKLPATVDALSALPGIGPYTAGAIASIAFGIAAPAVDGNVQRVFARLCNDSQDIALPASKRKTEAAVLREMGSESPSDFNQALMDLGATICLPNGEPKCELCPIAAFCEAKKHATQMELPVKTGKKARKIEEKTIAIVRYGAKVLLHQRPEKGLLANLWEPLMLAGSVGETAIRKELEAFGFAVLSCRTLDNEKHIFTHVEWHMTGYLMDVTLTKEETLPKKWRFVDEQEMLAGYALPSAFKPFFDQALETKR